MLPASSADAEGLYRLAWMLEHDAGTGEAAIAAYREAAAIAPPLLAVDALFRAGFVAQGCDLRQTAIDAYRACLARARENDVGPAAAIHAAYWLAFNLEAEGRYLEALEHYGSVPWETGLLALEAAYHGLLCLAAIGRFPQALDWSRNYRELAAAASAQGHDTRALVAAIERERAELSLVLRMEGAA